MTARAARTFAAIVDESRESGDSHGVAGLTYLPLCDRVSLTVARSFT